MKLRMITKKYTIGPALQLPTKSILWSMIFILTTLGVKSKYIFSTLSSTQTSSVQHIGSTQGPSLFSTQNPSVQHQNPLSSTQKNPPFHTPLSSTQKPLNSTHPSVPHQKPFSSTLKTPRFNNKNPSVLFFVCGVC